MNKATVRRWIEEVGIIPAIRLRSAEDAVFALEPLAESGIPIAEVTMTVPGAIEAVRELAQKASELLVGAGAARWADAATMFRRGRSTGDEPGVDLELVELSSSNATRSCFPAR